MSEGQEGPKSGIKLSDYRQVRPVVKRIEQTIDEGPKEKRLTRRGAALAALSMQPQINKAQEHLDEAVVRAESAEKRLGKDPLTGINNKEKFKEELKEAIKAHNRLEGPFSVLMIDLDDFKDVNEKYGHLVGDITIKEVAKLIESTVRGNDIVARFGGDEFAAILTGASEQSALEFAERLRNAIKLHLLGKVSANMPGRDKPFTASIGIASFIPKGEDLKNEPIDKLSEELIRKADTALFNSKRNESGKELKDTVTTYREGMKIPIGIAVHTEIDRLDE
ncbi:GGDEF domain-containing protein [Patescibacteria group bacterium]|nr:GGDEF domain-containing protein [Patescibacteria group bacterium]